MYELEPRLPDSLVWIDRALALDPDDETAQAMRKGVAAELATEHPCCTTGPTWSSAT